MRGFTGELGMKELREVGAEKEMLRGYQEVRREGGRVGVKRDDSARMLEVKRTVETCSVCSDRNYVTYPEDNVSDGVN